MAKLEGDKFLI